MSLKDESYIDSISDENEVTDQGIEGNSWTGPSLGVTSTPSPSGLEGDD